MTATGMLWEKGSEVCQSFKYFELDGDRGDQVLTSTARHSPTSPGKTAQVATPVLRGHGMQ